MVRVHGDRLLLLHIKERLDGKQDAIRSLGKNKDKFCGHNLYRPKGLSMILLGLLVHLHRRSFVYAHRVHGRPTYVHENFKSYSYRCIGPLCANM
jgi:hypothetical protein